MPLTLQQIIDEAAVLVPNAVETADQVLWLNEVNKDFFNVVKIPAIAIFTTFVNVPDYHVSLEIQERNIDLVMAGALQYRNLYDEDIRPFQNQYGFDDLTHTLTLSPAPYQTGMRGTIRYRRIATTTFSSGNLSATPDVPDEYQWTFIPALASFLARTQDDLTKAAGYENQYKAGWNVAAANY